FIILFFWLYLILALCVKLSSKGPALFKQERLGKNGKVFTMYKFRSTCVNAEHTGTGVYSFKDDPRVTKVGKFLRNTSLDELPQLFNILKGDMSLVGPRPVLTYHPWTFDKYTDEQKKRFEVRPGVTGWAQVNGRKQPPWDIRLKLDAEYVEKMSFCFDIKIIFLTVKSVFKNSDNENTSETAVTPEKDKADIK
ncbi:MAG: sugar transferase, partial [Clostridia bacterium]|nr:sugar transferase [Clostridia bacterium]